METTLFNVEWPQMVWGFEGVAHTPTVANPMSIDCTKLHMFTFYRQSWSIYFFIIRRYPTCKRVDNGVRTCETYVCPPSKVCKIDGGIPKCFDDSSKSEYISFSSKSPTCLSLRIFNLLTFSGTKYNTKIFFQNQWRCIIDIFNSIVNKSRANKNWYE